MEYYQPVPISDRSNKHKFQVRVWNPKTGRDENVQFGHKDYEDYTQHNDDYRRENYLTRSAGIRDGQGRLTKDNPLSSNYWSRRFLWASREPWRIYLPPGYKTQTKKNVIIL